jgi:excisionase family DNA binding protein
MQTIQVQNFTLQELQEMLRATVQDQLKPMYEAIAQQGTSVTELPENMTIKEVAIYLRISTVTVWEWTKSGKLKAYRLSNRKYYKRDEVKEVLKNAKIRYA